MVESVNVPTLISSSRLDIVPDLDKIRASFNRVEKSRSEDKREQCMKTIGRVGGLRISIILSTTEK